MDNGILNHMHTDKDKAPTTHGIKEEGVQVKPEPSPGSGEAGNGPAIGGNYGTLEGSLQDLKKTKMEELPDELQHITVEIMPLSLLLSRLAQFSHAKLQELILNLSSKPLPEITANGNVNGMVNGNVKGPVNGFGPPTEDTSPQSLDKKAMILNFIQDLHSRWVKALVITEWARNADEVGKLIDLRQHLADKLELYSRTFWDLVKVKQELIFAKVPSPDLKTALEVLSTGAVHWMPDFGYVPKPALTDQEKSHWLNEIEVTMHMRLQLHEYEQIPRPWKQYKIGNGRVTFTVPGEFEVDLTISDDEFDTQFWFLDYRMIFSPTPPELSASARPYVEAMVNSALQKDGLAGCYKFLHELTLTTKIGEFTRQAVELSRSGLWTNSLRIERLDRALSIQYWAHSPQSQGTQHWILLGVHSAKASEGLHDPGTPSHIMLQWFRDGKEVKDADIPLDVDDICVQRLLTTIISKHIEHILSSIFNQLSSKPRYAEGEGGLVLHISKEDPLNSSLTMHLGEEKAVLRIGPWMGQFHFLQPSPIETEWKYRFNLLRNAANDGGIALERLRWSYTARRLRMLPKPAQWTVLAQAPAPMDEVKRVVFSRGPASREMFQPVWIRNERWNPHWFAMMSLSLGGDRWWLIKISADTNDVTGRRITTFIELPILPADILLPSTSLISELDTCAKNIMAEIDDLRGLHQQQAPHVAGKSGNDGNLTTHVQSPDMMDTFSVPVEDVVRPPWAAKIIPIVYKGSAPTPMAEYLASVCKPGSLQGQPPQRVMVEATVIVTNRAKFNLLQPKLDRDVLYDHRRGRFTLRFRPECGSGAVPLLQARMQALDRLVDIIDALQRGGKHITPEKITLRKVIFRYGDRAPASAPSEQPPALDQERQRPWKVCLHLAKEEGVDVILQQGNPHLRVIDYLRASANSKALKKLPAWLIFSLPLFRAVERLQDSWNTVFAKEQGACYVFHKSMDWVTIRFALSGAKARRVHIDIRPRDRKGSLVWHVYRPATDANVNNENDEFNKVLRQRVWSTSGKGFKGLMNGAAATWDHGIEPLVALIGESILTLVGTPAPIQQLQQPQHAQQKAQPQQQPPQAAQGQEQQQQPAAPHQTGYQARFAQLQQQAQKGYPQNHHQQQQGRVPPQQQQQQHMPQANMLGQGQQHQGGQQQQRKNNAPVVVLD